MFIDSHLYKHNSNIIYYYFNIVIICFYIFPYNILLYKFFLNIFRYNNSCMLL